MSTLHDGIKIVLIGETQVGKTCITKRYVDNIFSESEKLTIGASFVLKMVSKGENNFQLLLWDTAGQEKYSSMTPLFYQGAKFAIIVFAINNLSSFKKVDFWYNSVRESTNEIKMLLVGNKSDLDDERAVPFEDALAKASDLGIEYFETSAKTNIGIDAVFAHIVDIVDEEWNKTAVASVETINENETEDSKCC